jgi:hypothetical protein
MDKKELELITAELGCNSRRLSQIYNANTSSACSSDLYEAAQKADSAYEAMKRVMETFE